MQKEYLIKSSEWTHSTPVSSYNIKPAINSLGPEYEQFLGWQVVIMVNSQCTVTPRCSHCYISYNGNFDPDDLLQTVTTLQTNGYNVYLNGTEPLMNSRYLEAIKQAGQRVIMTNGLILINNPYYIEDIKAAGIEMIGISYHFDMQKNFTKVSLEEAQQALDIVKNAEISARVMTTITKPNIEKIPEYIAWTAEQGYKNIRFTNYIAQGNANSRDLILSDDDCKRYYEIISKERQKYPKDILCIDSCGSFGNCSPNMTCMAIDDFVVMTPDKKIYPCIFAAGTEECGKYINGNIFIKKNLEYSRHDCYMRRKCNF